MGAKKQAVPTDDDLAQHWIDIHSLGTRRMSGSAWLVVEGDVVKSEVLAVVRGAKSEGVRPTKARVDSVTELARLDVAIFTEYAKIIWAMNELPRVGDDGDDLSGRVKVVRFPVLAGQDRDPVIKEAVATKGAGILNWALLVQTALAERRAAELARLSGEL